MKLHGAILLAVCLPLHAQQEQLPFGSVSNEIGLSIAGQHCIVQDSRGFIWFGGDNGLYRYDGYVLKVYRHDPRDSNSIPPGEISTICEDRFGTLWVAVVNVGFERFDVSTEHFTHFNHDPADSTSRSPNPVYSILESRDGNLWLGSLRGAGEFDREKLRFKQYQHNSAGPGSLPWSASVLYEDRSGTMWLGTWGGGLAEYNRKLGTFRQYRHDSSDSSSLSNDRVHAICETSDGMLWIGTWGGGLDRFDRRTSRFKHFMHDPGLAESISDNYITSILQTRNGALWVGTWSGGLNLFDKERGAFHWYRHDGLLKNSLCDNKVTSLCEDRSGILWIGTRGGVSFLDAGRKRFAYQKTKPTDLRTPDNNFVTSIFRDSAGRLWIGTKGGGVDRIGPSGNEYRHFGYSSKDPGSLDGNEVSSICQDVSGTIWIATSGALNMLEEDDQHFVRFLPDPADSNSLGDDAINSIAADRSGILWIGLNMSGVDEYDRATGRFKHHRHAEADPHSLNDNQVLTVHIDTYGTLWVGTGAGGLEEYDRKTKEFLHHVHDPEKPSTLSSNGIPAIYEDTKGGFWVRTDEGLDQFDRETGIAVHCTTNDELPRGLYALLQEDNKGNLWFTTKRGVAKLNPRTRFERVYGLSDDLEIRSPQDIVQPAAQGEQRLFLGSARGLISFSPDSIVDNSYVPPIVITAFKKFYKDYKLPKDITATEAIVLSHDDDVISFDFAALSFAHPEKNQYAYKLEGFDGSWVYSGAGRTATYTHLDPGEYVFRVKGSNSDGLWNESGTSVRVTITPPFWATWWFRVGFFAALLLSAGGTVRKIEMRKMKRTIERLRQERALERERARISEDMHDEVGANLTKIAIISELALKTASEADGMTAQLQNISHTARELVDNIGAIVWAINPKNDRLDNLAGYMREYIAEYFETTPIACRFSFPDELPVLRLSAEERRNIFLTMKEAIHNVVKHSGATEVRIGLCISGRQLELRIEDNGKGFVLDGIARYGNGLSNMRKRVETINGTFDVRPQPGSGTRIGIVVPLKQEIPLK